MPVLLTMPYDHAMLDIIPTIYAGFYCRQSMRVFIADHLCGFYGISARNCCGESSFLLNLTTLRGFTDLVYIFHEDVRIKCRTRAIDLP